MPKPVLLIIGHGVAGVRVAVGMAPLASVDVVVIEPHDFIEVPFAAVRAIVVPETGDQSIIPLSSFKGYKIIRGKVQTLTSKAAVLESGEQVAFDYCVVATGSTYSGDGVIQAKADTLEGRKAELAAAATSIKNAKDIVVVGGGAVGVETVGEIVSKYAGKNVTLLHSRATLIDDMAIKVHNHLMQLCKEHQVQVVLQDKADKWDQAAGILTTKGGKQLPAEYVIWATGSSPNTKLMAGGDLASTVNEQGRIKVDDMMRVVGFPNIYAIGDVNDTPQAKLGYLAGLQADATVANLKAAVSGKVPRTKFSPPMQPKGMMIVSFGSGAGTARLSSCVCKGGFLVNMKAKDLFVGQARKDWGL